MNKRFKVKFIIEKNYSINYVNQGSIKCMVYNNNFENVFKLGKGVTEEDDLFRVITRSWIPQSFKQGILDKKRLIYVGGYVTVNDHILKLLQTYHNNLSMLDKCLLASFLLEKSFTYGKLDKILGIYEKRRAKYLRSKQKEEDDFW